MKKSRRGIASLLIFIMVILSFSGCSGVKKLPEKNTLDEVLKSENYKLVFSDEFDGDKLDTTVWRVGYNTPQRRGGYYLNSDDTVFVKDGNLVIRTSYKEDGIYGEGWYTSWIESCTDKNGGEAPVTDDFVGFSAKYGYYEIRCKVPKSEGIWSAFWMMPNESTGMSKNDIIGTGEDGVEIDVMESPWYYRKNPDINQHALHGDGYELNKTDSSPLFNVKNMYDEFHTYGVMWTETEYIFYIDGKETWRTKHTVDGEELGVSQAREYLLMTVEIGGYTDDDGVVHTGKELSNGEEVDCWCGNPNNNDKSKNYDFVVDYIRVYQK